MWSYGFCVDTRNYDVFYIYVDRAHAIIIA